MAGLRGPNAVDGLRGPNAVDVVVGAGHNGLVAACYLARAGRDVLVLEALDRPGGGSRTEETVPSYRFDLHSVAHNIINMTDIPAELDLAGAGLEYQEMDPFSIAVMEDGRRVRFHRSVDETVESIAEESAEDAAAYRRFIQAADPVVRLILPAIRGRMRLNEAPARTYNLLRVLGRQPATALRDVLSPYQSLLQRWLASDLTRGPVAAFAAHAGVGPMEAGGSLFAFWQAAYHRFGQWHARTGARGLTDALVRRLQSYGGEVRCDAPVARIEAPGSRVRAVVLESGERIPAAHVVTALDPQLALLRLLDPPLSGALGADLAATRRGNVVQALVHVATDRLPPYANARPGDWNGLQSYVDRLDDLSAAWTEAEAGRLANPPPLYAFTTSALDGGLAPPGHHTVYLASPAAPSRLVGGWPARREEFVEACLDVVEARAPGFRASVQGTYAWTPDLMQRGGRWPGAHPMHLDITLDQLGPLRPTRALGDHRTPVAGLYVSGAGTNPSGGIAGTPGRMAALALLADVPARLTPSTVYLRESRHHGGMSRWCPVCRKGWPDEWSVCGDCVAGLVDELDATVRCRHCDKEWPARMQSCPECLGELRDDPEAAATAMGDLLARGMRLPRPAGTKPFADGVECTLLRVAPRSSLLFTGPSELVEAHVEGRDHRAVPPLDCRDIDGTRLFRLKRYPAHDDALVAVTPDGTPLATFLRTGGVVQPGLDVRDETSAPVGRLCRAPGGWTLVETGGQDIAQVAVVDATLGDHVDDQWSLYAIDDRRRLPLKPLGAVALVLAGKVLLGRPAPDPVKAPQFDEAGNIVT